MNKSSSVSSRWRNWLTAGFALSAVLALSSAAKFATAQDIVHIEEDWTLLVGTPDANSVGPQIAVTMSPFNDIKDTYFTLEINHRSLPYWTPGGITLHQWAGEWRIQSLDRADRSVMNTSNETVTWTQILDVQGGVLTFQVKNGSSTTWGPFGYSGHLKLMTGWGVNNINSYTPNVSVARSGVAYAGNRVQLLKITEIRATLSDGSTFTDDTGWTVHQLVE